MKKVIVFLMTLAVIIAMCVIGTGCDEAEQPSEDLPGDNGERLGFEEARQDIEKHYGFEAPIWLEPVVLNVEGRGTFYIFSCLVYEDVERGSELFRYDFVVSIEVEDDGDIDVDTELIYHGGHNV